MKTILKLGKVDGYGNGRKTCAVEIKVELTDDGRFTASGDLRNSSHTDILMGGQCLDELKDKYESVRNNPKFKQVYQWWKAWHLNDMHAGTEKQESALIEHFGDENRDYTEQCEYLESIGLLEDNGYKYGTAWLKREIPAEIQEQMRTFIEENNND